MATWELTIDNANNASTKVYIMEDDGTGLINTPEDLLYLFWPVPPHTTKSDASNVIKRYLQYLAIGGTTFTSPCQEIAGRGTGTLTVSENTTALKVWTYSDGAWTVKDNITKSIADRATIAVPSLAAKKK